MNLLAAYDLKRLTRFDVWSVLVIGNFLFVLGLVVTLVVSLRRDKVERTPANLEEFLSDEELEGPHLERVLGWALFFFAVFAITLPLYWLHEASRGKGTVEYFDKNSEERGEALFSQVGMPRFNAALSLQCAGCHGADGSGGSKSTVYIDPKTGIAHNVAWKAPALNTVLYRFSPQEVNDIITRGRPGTPMQGWGVDKNGGGPKNAQSINDLVNYLKSIQLKPGTQAEGLKDLTGCRKDIPEPPKTALGQTMCRADEWKRQPETQLKAAQAAKELADKTLAEDEAKFAELKCADTFNKDAKEPVECGELRRKVRDTPDLSTPTARKAVTGAESRLKTALGKPKVDADEKAAAELEIKNAKKKLADDEAAYAKKNCAGTFLKSDTAACMGLERALNDQMFIATDQVAVDKADKNLAWAQEWKARREGVTDGQILFETNCARCHTSHWSIFDPTNTDLKPEELLGNPGGGGSIGFNLRDQGTVSRFPDVRDSSGEIVENSGLLNQLQFILKGSFEAKPYGNQGNGSGRMPGQCNDDVKSDASAKLEHYGCMMWSASTPSGGSPTKWVASAENGGVNFAMLEQIVLYERCGLDAKPSASQDSETERLLNDLSAVTGYETGCK